MNLNLLKKMLFVGLLLGQLSCDIVRQNHKFLDKAEIQFLDVGQGDATLIKNDKGLFALIDSGPNSKILKKYLLQNKVDTLEWVILTHADKDHFYGLGPNLSEVFVKKIFLPLDSNVISEWHGLLQAIKKHKIKVDSLFVGDKIKLGKSISIDVVWPLRTDPFRGNNSSTALILHYGNSKVFFAGDLEQEAEARLVREQLLESVEILKVSHHGSKSSSYLPFLSELNPNWSVISCDSSVYGHPHIQTLTRLGWVMSNTKGILRTEIETY